MNMLRYMQPFHTDIVPNVLFTGNGLHRAFENAGWDKLLKDLSGGRFTEDEWDSLKNLRITKTSICSHIIQYLPKQSPKYNDRCKGKENDLQS